MPVLCASAARPTGSLDRLTSTNSTSRAASSPFTRVQNEHGRGDEIRENHPHQREQTRVERALEVGEGDDQGPRVGGGKQHSQTRAGEGPPLVVLVAGGDAEARSRI